MAYSVKTTDVFEKQAKRLVKKYASLKTELLALIHSLEADPLQGTPLGNNCYKIRLAIESKGRGKSGGARLITNIVITHNTVYLLALYDKSEQDNLTNSELKQLLAQIPA